MVPRIPGRASIRARRGQAPATLTNDNAGVGRVGEYIESVVVLGSAIGLSSGVAANVTSIPLSGGDWLVGASGLFLPAATTNQQNQFVSISMTSATLDLSPGRLGTHQFGSSGLVTGASAAEVKAGPIRIPLSAATTIYLVVRSTFTVDTNSAYGILWAIRPR